MNFFKLKKMYFIDVTHIAVDWISGNWYFVDDFNEMIFVCSSPMTFCVVLIDVNITTPRAIALDPTKG